MCLLYSSSFDAYCPLILTDATSIGGPSFAECCCCCITVFRLTENFVFVYISKLTDFVVGCFSYLETVLFVVYGLNIEGGDIIALH